MIATNARVVYSNFEEELRPVFNGMIFTGKTARISPMSSWTPSSYDHRNIITIFLLSFCSMLFYSFVGFFLQFSHFPFQWFRLWEQRHALPSKRKIQNNLNSSIASKLWNHGCVAPSLALMTPQPIVYDLTPFISLPPRAPRVLSMQRRR